MPQPWDLAASAARIAGTGAIALSLAACSAPPGPREARIDRGLGERIGLAPTEVSGTVGAQLTLTEIRARHVEPRCERAGLVMTSLRVRRRPDGAQEFEARCGLALVP